MLYVLLSLMFLYSGNLSFMICLHLLKYIIRFILFSLCPIPDGIFIQISFSDLVDGIDQIDLLAGLQRGLNSLICSCISVVVQLGWSFSLDQKGIVLVRDVEIIILRSPFIFFLADSVNSEAVVDFIHSLLVEP